MKFITKKQLNYSVFITIISATIAFVVFIISITGTALFAKSPIFNLNHYESIGMILAGVLELVFINRIFKLKRFKKGLTFLKEEKFSGNIMLLGIVLSGMVVIIYTILSKTKNDDTTVTLISGAILVAIGIFIWAQKSITSHYKNLLKKDTIKLLESELIKEKAEKDKIYKELETIATINHKYAHKISALEYKIEKYNSLLSANIEFSNEIANMKDAVKELSSEYTAEITKKMVGLKDLSKTGFLKIDNMLEYFKANAQECKIDFVFEQEVDIRELVNEIIEEERIEILIADHVKDAIIAVEHSKNLNKTIKLKFCKENGIYALKIYDTGIEFEINTLTNLGAKPITTYKKEGGSGLGFITTFETLKKCKASLFIEEFCLTEKNIYTKGVSIHFDGKEEYRIKSYRMEEILKSAGENKTFKVVV
jgi:hypothetical protein